MEEILKTSSDIVVFKAVQQNWEKDFHKEKFQSSRGVKYSLREWEIKYDIKSFPFFLRSCEARSLTHSFPRRQCFILSSFILFHFFVENNFEIIKINENWFCIIKKIFFFIISSFSFHVFPFLNIWNYMKKGSKSVGSEVTTRRTDEQTKETFNP